MIKIFHEKPSGFVIRCEVSTIFMEYENKILLLQRTTKDSSEPTWGIPGGKLENDETPKSALMREMQEELDINPDPSNLSFIQSVYLDRKDIQYKLHLFKWELQRLPKITLNPKEHTAFIWHPLEQVDHLNLLAGQIEAFKLVYKNL